MSRNYKIDKNYDERLDWIELQLEKADKNADKANKFFNNTIKRIDKATNKNTKINQSLVYAAKWLLELNRDKDEIISLLNVSREWWFSNVEKPV